MSTDEMTTQAEKVTQFGTEIPFVQPTQSLEKRPSGIFGRLRHKRGKADFFIKAMEFARQLLPLRMNSKVMQKSIKLQYGLTTRETRQAIKAMKPKKHRSRHHSTGVLFVSPPCAHFSVKKKQASRR